MEVTATPVEDKRSRTNWALAAGAALLVAAVGAALVIVYSSLSGQIDDLEDRAVAAETELAATKTALGEATAAIEENAEALREAGTTQIELFKAETEESLTATNNTVKTLNTKVARIQECLPEMQAYVDGMSVTTYDTNGWVTGAYISNGQQISRRCEGLIRPRRPGE